MATRSSKASISGIRARSAINDSHMVGANRFTADGMDEVMAALGHETIENGKITQSVWCRAPAP